MGVVWPPPHVTIQKETLRVEAYCLDWVFRYLYAIIGTCRKKHFLPYCCIWDSFHATRVKNYLVGLPATLSEVATNSLFVVGCWGFHLPLLSIDIGICASGAVSVAFPDELYGESSFGQGFGRFILVRPDIYIRWS